MKNKNLLRFVSIIVLASMALAMLSACGVANNGDAESSNINIDSSSSSGEDVPVNATPTKKVALTFDDGPHNVRTIKIVDALEQYGFNATFFVVGNRVDGSEYNGANAVKYAAEKGNEIAIHGYTHSTKNYYDICDDSTYKFELSETENAIKSVVPGQVVRLMRPVGGRITSERVQSCEYSVIMWDVDSEDWYYKYTSNDTEDEAAQKVNTIVDNVMSTVRDGSIILMHDIYESTYDAVLIILERLHAEGYEVVTVSELIGDDLVAGKRYSSAR